MKYGLILFFVSGLLVLGQTGCLFWGKSFQPTSHYDLDPAKTSLESAGFRVEFSEFTTTEPIRFKMVYRDRQCRLLVDSYNKWIQPPGAMLSRYLRVVFRDHNAVVAEGTLSYRIAGDIFMFQIDIERKQVNLGVDYSISEGSASGFLPLLQRSAFFSEPFTESTPSEFAAAMSRCAARFAAQLDQELRSIKAE